ncbi:MAG TPA: glucose-6-phosphate isomerase [Usitatibacteraceae bacterium]|nr:glucose-6-phosphate isomerase [Usitatibacteraceae bacterium]
MPSPTPTPAWQALEAHRDAIAALRVDELFAADPGRGPALTFACAGLAVDFSKQRITPETLERLVTLARERDMHGAIERLFTGQHVNVTEDRPALHTALRGDEKVAANGENVLAHVQRCRERMRVLSTTVRDGTWKGAKGGRIRHVLSLGIGGSYLGPRLVVEALAARTDGPEVRFLANIDPAALDDALAGLDPASTLVIIASKTFATQETMANAAAARDWITASLGEGAVAKHMVAATANAAEAARFGLPECNVLPFGDWVGGRYSVWSSVGLPAAIALGMPAFERFLAGAHAVDLEFRSAPLERNVPVLLALAGVWNRDFLDIPVHLVLPYAQRLASLPGYLQQLEMESNGKRVDVHGAPVTCPTCPAIFGEVGTLGQHAFYQWLHQGTDAASCDFVVVARPMGSREAEHRVLLANALAQSEALMTGRSTGSPHRDCPGNRPSTTLVLPCLEPAALGALIALYEHKVYAQSVLWGVNAFDQFGVELGKAIAGRVLPAFADPASALHPATSHLLGVIRKAAQGGQAR